MIDRSRQSRIETLVLWIVVGFSALFVLLWVFGVRPGSARRAPAAAPQAAEAPGVAEAPDPEHVLEPVSEPGAPPENEVAGEESEPVLF